jgi:tol-pal system protein YbgF
MKNIKLAALTGKTSWDNNLPPGQRAVVNRGFFLYLLALLPVIFGFFSGCESFSAPKKYPPLQTQLNSSSEHPPSPPTPLEPGSVAKTSQGPVHSSGGSSVSDTRLADLASQFEALRARLQVVEGKLAEQENQLNQLTRSGNPDQRGMRDQLTALQRDLAAAQERLARLESGRLSSSTPATPAAPPPIKEIPPPQTAPKTGGDLFQEGLASYKQKSYGVAKDKFQQFLKDHPKGDKSLEARYYLADSLLQEKKYDEAIVEFNKVVEGNPKSSFAPPALLKQAQAFKAQGKTKVSNLVLEKLVADYPKSPEAVQARRLQGKTQ